MNIGLKIVGAASFGAALSFGVGNTTFVSEAEVQNRMLEDCQLDIKLDNILTKDCSMAVIEIAGPLGQLDRNVHTSPVLEEFDGLDSPGRLALTMDPIKDRLIDELEEKKEDVLKKRILGILGGIGLGLMTLAFLDSAKKSRLEYPEFEEEIIVSDIRDNFTFLYDQDAEVNLRQG